MERDVKIFITRNPFKAASQVRNMALLHLYLNAKCGETVGSFDQFEKSFIFGNLIRPSKLMTQTYQILYCTH